MAPCGHVRRASHLSDANWGTQTVSSCLQHCRSRRIIVVLPRLLRQQHIARNEAIACLKSETMSRRSCADALEIQQLSAGLLARYTLGSFCLSLQADRGETASLLTVFASDVLRSSCSDINKAECLTFMHLFVGRCDISPNSLGGCMGWLHDAACADGSLTCLPHSTGLQEVMVPRLAPQCLDVTAERRKLLLCGARFLFLDGSA